MIAGLPARFFHDWPSSIVGFFPRVVFFAPDSEATVVITSSIGRVACLRFGAGLLVPLQGAAARCCCQSACAAAGAACAACAGAAGAAAAGSDRHRVATLRQKCIMTACAQCFVDFCRWLQRKKCMLTARARARCFLDFNHFLWFAEFIGVPNESLQKTMLVMWLQRRDVPSVFHSACHKRFAFSGVMWVKSTTCNFKMNVVSPTYTNFKVLVASGCV